MGKEVANENWREFNTVRAHECKIESTIDRQGLVLKKGQGRGWWPMGYASLLDGEWHVSYQDRVINLGEVDPETVIAYMWEWRGYGGVEPLTLEP